MPRAASTVQSVAILFEASPGFGVANGRVYRFVKFQRVAILFEASPGFGVKDGQRIGSLVAFVAILFEASPGFGGNELASAIKSSMGRNPL